MLANRLFFIWLLFICLFHDLSSQTIENCIERVTKDVINNHNANIPPEAVQIILESCEYQSNQEGSSRGGEHQTEDNPILNDPRYDSQINVVFDNYHDFVEYSASSPTYGIYQHIQQIIDSMRTDIISFEARWSYAVIKTHTNSADDTANNAERTITATQSTDNYNADNLSFLTQQISFEDKSYIEYLKSLMNGIDEEELWSLSYSFANKQFEFIDINKLKETYESFGATLEFEIQIYCEPNPTTNNNDNEPFLIWNGGAGGGGGYNEEHDPAFQYGGGGGIQMNNDSVSVGGGTDYRYHDEWRIDDIADTESFYDVEVPKFEQWLKNTELCNQIRVQSGGGSSGGFTEHGKNSTLQGFTYYALNFVVGSNSGYDDDDDNDNIDGNEKSELRENILSKTAVTTLISIILCSLVITILLVCLWCFCTKSRKYNIYKFQRGRINSNEDEFEDGIDDEFEMSGDEGQKENIFDCLLWIH